MIFSGFSHREKAKRERKRKERAEKGRVFKLNIQHCSRQEREPSFSLSHPTTIQLGLWVPTVVLGTHLLFSPQPKPKYCSRALQFSRRFLFRYKLLQIKKNKIVVEKQGLLSIYRTIPPTVKSH